ncbi:MAG: hypothetical protein RL755_72 [Pseudomonadota bacterium]|jgi:hypothetical protein
MTTELDIARQIANGELPSPQKAGDSTVLLDIRITGTGVAYRAKLNEFVSRNPDYYLNDDFLASCNGAPVIWEHPDGNKLNSDEFADRVIGTVFFPYLKDSEVWGIAKIYDQYAIDKIMDGGLSTSPTVIFDKQQPTQQIEINGKPETILIEGEPSIIDHVAITENGGVWDKGQEPNGINLSINTTEGDTMPDEVIESQEHEAQEESVQAQILAALGKISERLDALEGAKADAVAPPAPETPPAEPAQPVAEVKADDDIPNRIAEVEKKLDSMTAKPAVLSDSDMEEVADSEGKGAELSHVFGDSNPIRAMQGETPTAFRKRLIRKYQKHSPAFKDSNVDMINDAATLKSIEATVYADSMKAAKSPNINTGSNMPREIKHESMGRTTIEFVGGEPGAVYNQFKAASRTGRLGAN